jgi:hypothetical protein
MNTIFFCFFCCLGQILILLPYKAVIEIIILDQPSVSCKCFWHICDIIATDTMCALVSPCMCVCVCACISVWMCECVCMDSDVCGCAYDSKTHQFARSIESFSFSLAICIHKFFVKTHIQTLRTCYFIDCTEKTENK